MPGLIKDRIETMKKALGIDSDKALEIGGDKSNPLISNGLLGRWRDKDVDSFSSTVLDAFLRHYDVNRSWWMTGEGPIFNKKLTPVGESSKRNDQMSSDEVLKALGSIVEDSTDYKLVPSTLLNGEYRIVLAKEIDQRDQLLKEILKDKNLLIETLKEEIQELRSRKSSQKTH
jgi:hypothetical protein